MPPHDTLDAVTRLAQEALTTAQRTEYLLTESVLGVHPRRDRGADQVAQLLLTERWAGLLRSGDPLPALTEVEATFFSQNGEDGVLLYLFALLGHGNRTSAEICAGDCIECCTANLVVNHGWYGLMADGNADNIRRGQEFYAHSRHQWFDPPAVEHAWITAESAPDLLVAAGVADSLDLLVVDLDGMDFWIWKALADFRPRVVVIEVNPALGDASLTLAYRADFAGPEVPVAGTSLAAAVSLGKELGYTFAGTERFGINAFFVRDDVVPAGLASPTVAAVLDQPSVRRSAARLEVLLAPHRASLTWVSDPR
jgi:hypothetical protein